MRVTRTSSIVSLCLILFWALAGSAFAQQQEKRIALVVGNSAYAKSPLATAANDAGLIAQTLQAAGFDVVGARDLDGDTLRRSFRDFIQKAEASGPGTVAIVYLAGYGMQLAGENYFIPVDSAIGRETDIPTEALRISDYVRQLGSLGKVTRIQGATAVDNAIAFARFQSHGFGWGVTVPGHNFALANQSRPGDAAASAALGSNGIYSPLLLTDNASALPRSLEGYFLDVQPGFENGDPSQGVFNHVWVLGAADAVSEAAQGRIDQVTQLIPVDQSAAPGG